ncbi:hypothetical protein CCM_09588 [Cordyceps militaris CM01]|uniref:Uncharacterized protein n=1 Tax=Cordyceps militaris (strain CM01) TaxID=983644 RepID=G3JUU7_CORMM|nr:uncharacterized protein CCM_09588 [Cordyceps militaris CM01]EGX87627.1 hypothetical protein CCM_09588 [Cordyceps militaris CM01]
MGPPSCFYTVRIKVYLNNNKSNNNVNLLNKLRIYFLYILGYIDLVAKSLI